MTSPAPQVRRPIGRLRWWIIGVCFLGTAINFTWVIGIVVDRVSYTPIFLAAGLMPLVALVLVQILIPTIAATEPRTTPA